MVTSVGIGLNPLMWVLAAFGNSFVIELAVFSEIRIRKLLLGISGKNELLTFKIHKQVVLKVTIQ